jgi:MFS family permease
MHAAISVFCRFFVSIIHRPLPPSRVAAVLAAFALNSWLPIIIKNMLAGTALANSSSGSSSSSNRTQEATLLAAIPYVCATVANLAVAWHADRVNERLLHTGVPYVLGGVVLACFSVLTRVSFAAGFAGLVVTMACAYGGQSPLLASVAGEVTAICCSESKSSREPSAARNSSFRHVCCKMQ